MTLSSESGGSSKGYAPMDLDAANAYNADSLTTILLYQQDTCLTCYYCGKKGHFTFNCHLKV